MQLVTSARTLARTTSGVSSQNGSARNLKKTNSSNNSVLRSESLGINDLDTEDSYIAQQQPPPQSARKQSFWQRSVQQLRQFESSSPGPQPKHQLTQNDGGKLGSRLPSSELSFSRPPSPGLKYIEVPPCATPTRALTRLLTPPKTRIAGCVPDLDSVSEATEPILDASEIRRLHHLQTETAARSSGSFSRRDALVQNSERSSPLRTTPFANYMTAFAMEMTGSLDASFLGIVNTGSHDTPNGTASMYVFDRYVKTTLIYFPSSPGKFLAFLTIFGNLSKRSGTRSP